MKSIETLSNVQRAKLLFDLFQAEAVEFTGFITETAQKIIADKEKLKSNSEGGMFPTAVWITLAESVNQKVKQHEGKLNLSSSVFSEQLFLGDISFFSKNYLLQFSHKSKNAKFKVAVELFFL